MKTPAISILGVVLLTSAMPNAAPESEKESEFTVTAPKSSVSDFASFVTGLSHIAQNKPVGLSFPASDGRRLLTIGSESSYGFEFPDQPSVIHLAGATVSLGTGPSRHQVGLDRLRLRLRTLVEVAAKSDSRAIPVLLVGSDVSGAFGFRVLEIVSDAGVTHLRIAAPVGKSEPRN